MTGYLSLCRSAAILAAVALSLTLPTVSLAFSEPTLAISAGNQMGAVYAVANALAKVFNLKSADYRLRISAVPSQGSLADIDNVIAGKAAFGIAHSAELEQVVRGLGPWQGRGNNGLRAVLALHTEDIAVVAARDLGIETLADLAGKRVSIGEPGSGDYYYASTLLELAGVPKDRLTLNALPVSLAPDALQRNEIDAYVYLAGHPNLSVLEASTGPRKVFLVSLGEPLVTKLAALTPLMIPRRIATGYYPGLAGTGEVSSVGFRAVLFARADLDETSVYRLVKEVLGNFQLFQRQHPLLDGLTRKSAAEVTVLPLHPGAARYFREAGLDR